METKSFFDHYRTLLLKHSAALFEIEWQHYGERLAVLDARKKRKYQGILLGYQTSRNVELAKFGTLPDEHQSKEVLSAKFGLLDSYLWVASVQGRNPKKGLWGGAVRCIGGALVGVTGLPEIGDHIVATRLVDTHGGYNSYVAGPVRDPNWPPLHEALEHAGMNREKFRELCKRIDSILVV